jgi:hypothetical protein
MFPEVLGLESTMGTWEERMTRRPDMDMEPRLDLIESSWQAKGRKSNRVISCGIYRTDAGVEVRAGYTLDDLVRTERVNDIGGAKDLASEWRRALIDTGFIELAPPDAL